jgi:hypothetical protein
MKLKNTKIKIHKTRILFLVCVGAILIMLYEKNNTDGQCLRKTVVRWLHEPGMEAGSGGYMNREWRQDLEAT